MQNIDVECGELVRDFINDSRPVGAREGKVQIRFYLGLRNSFCNVYGQVGIVIFLDRLIDGLKTFTRNVN